MAIVMGSYVFTCATTGDESCVEYTFGYKSCATARRASSCIIRPCRTPSCRRDEGEEGRGEGGGRPVAEEGKEEEKEEEKKPEKKSSRKTKEILGLNAKTRNHVQ